MTPHAATRPLAVACAATGMVLGTLLVAACGNGSDATTPGASAPWFEEAAAECGVTYRYESGATEVHRFPEIMGGGVALFDYDGDGDLDLYLVQSGSLIEPSDRPTNRLLRNEGAAHFVDVTAAAGVGHDGYGMGVCCGDYDGDGDTDLYVTNVGPNVLFQNNGDGTFRDVSESAGVANASWGTSCAFVDLDADDRLDLFVVNNLAWTETIEIECFNYYHEKDYCSPNNYNSPLPDVLYRNLGDGRFEDVTRASGIQDAYGNGLGVSCGDFDLDGRVDVYVANDARPNQLWHNLGGMKFEDVALESGCAVNGNGLAEAGMGVQFVDIESDGDLDLFMTHLRDESNTFYLNRSGLYGDVTRMTGMLGPSISRTGFGMGFADFDHDGQLDLFIANGAVQAWKQPLLAGDPYAEPNLLFRGLGDARFEQLAHAGLGSADADLLGTSRGAAFGDIDDDGDVDVVVVERDAPLRILRNVAPKLGRFVQLRVLAGETDALGARVEISAADRTWIRHVAPAYSYLSSNDARIHAGLGDARTVERVRVTWPGGAREDFGPLAVDAQHVLRAGEGRPAQGD